MKMKAPEPQRFKGVTSMLVVAVCGLATAVISGLALVPRVRLVEVLTVVAGAFGAGAAVVSAWIQFKQSRPAPRDGRAPR